MLTINQPGTATEYYLLDAMKDFLKPTVYKLIFFILLFVVLPFPYYLPDFPAGSEHTFWPFSFALFSGPFNFYLGLTLLSGDISIAGFLGLIVYPVVAYLMACLIERVIKR